MSDSSSQDYLHRLQWHGIRPGLERMSRLLSLLGHPEKQFRSVHVAGTNGKGSTAAMIASVLQAAGYQVGLYTSPHLIDFSERIRINGVLILSEEVIRLTGRLKTMIDAHAEDFSETLTFFEFTTALAFFYFAEAKVSWAVVEVGLGGRLDATNLLSPEVCAITNIGLDHQEYLGETIAEIASEKAGIIKWKTPVVTAVSQPAALSVLMELAEKQQAPLIRVGSDIFVEGSSPEDFLYRGECTLQIHCPLLGAHQRINSAVAIGVIEALQRKGVVVSGQAIVAGIEGVVWEGRLEVVRRDPLVLLDGAHNPAGARALADFLTGVDPEREGRHWLVVGIMKDKDIAGILEPLLPWADDLVFTRPNAERAADPLLLKIASKRQGAIYDTVSQAIEGVESTLGPRDTVVMTGSLYLVGEAKAIYSGLAPSPLRG